MRTNRWAIILVAVGLLMASGCYYKRPHFEKMYAKVGVGMARDDVVKALGEPYKVIENEMLYIYDDPDNPVRMRFQLNEQGVVIAKYFESKKDLAKRAEETKGQVPPGQPAPGEQPKYPGGPMPQFEARKPVS